MELDFSGILATIGLRRMFRLANARRPAANMLFAQLLPELPKFDYTASAGRMQIYSTMAGSTGMDSAYAQVGHVAGGDFKERVLKLTAQSKITEQQQIEFADILASALDPANTMIKDALNFLDKVIIESLVSRSEWLRGRALLGGFTWQWGNIEHVVDYGIPASNVLATRTGTAAYGGSASNFWADYRAARKILGAGMRTIMHPDMYAEIISNNANNIQVNAEDFTGQNGTASIQQLVSRGGNTVVSSDARDRATLTLYGESGNVYDPATTPGAASVLKKLEYMDRNAVLYIGSTADRGYIPGMDPEAMAAMSQTLGYTHMAPSIEAQNTTGRKTPGRWARLRTPEDRAWELIGEGVSWEMPVIENPDSIVVARSDLSA